MKQKKIISIFLLATLLLPLLPQPAFAGYWGESLKAALLKQKLEVMYKEIKEAIVAALKMMAIRLVQQRLQSLLGQGGKGSPGPIGDWRQFIYGSAQTYSQTQTRNYFQQVRSGTPQALQQRVIDPAQKAVMTDPTTIRPDLQKYVREGRADMIFQPGWAQNPTQAFIAAAQPQNSPAFYSSTGEGVQSESFRQKEEEKKTEGQAGLGMQGKKVGGGTAGSEGQTVTPGSIVAAMAAKVQGMPIDMVALSRSIPETVAAMVTQMLSQVLTQGLTQVTSQIGMGGNLGGLMGGMGGFQNMIGGGGMGGFQNMFSGGIGGGSLPGSFSGFQNMFPGGLGGLQNIIQGGGTSLPSGGGSTPSPLPSGFDRRGQD